MFLLLTDLFLRFCRNIGNGLVVHVMACVLLTILQVYIQSSDRCLSSCEVDYL
jgi:hypothetical protein